LIITKSYITKLLNSLPNYEVLTFNSHRAMPTGARGMPDHLLIGQRAIVFIEVKLYKDTLSLKQKLIKRLLTALSVNCRAIRYYELTDQNYQEVMQDICKI
jgi:hypothetical protein